MTDAEVKAHIRATGIDRFKSDMRDAQRSMTDLKSAATNAMSVVGAGFQMMERAAQFLTGGLAAAGIFASKTNADMEAMRMGLTAVLGSTQAMEAEWMRLAEIAKLPGLGMREAAEGVTRLVSTGLDLQLAERALRSFGNAIATVGGGKAELEGVSLALSQIVSKGAVSAEEINQIAERVPQIRRAMQAAFGTGDTEALQRMGLRPEQFVESVVRELERLPLVLGGAKNSFENFGDAAQKALDVAGGEINKTLIPAINTVARGLEFLTQSGFLRDFAADVTHTIGLIGKLFGGQEGWERVIAVSLAALEKMPSVVYGVTREMLSFAESTGQLIMDYINAPLRIINFALGEVEGYLRAIQVGLKWIDAVGQRLHFPKLEAAHTPINLPRLPDINLGNFLGSAFPTIFTGNPIDDVNRRADELMAAWKRSQQTGPPGLPAIPAVAGDPFGGIASPLQGIERNTLEIARNTEGWSELRRYVVGGSERAKRALSPVDISNRRRGAGGSGGASTLRVDAGGRKLSAAIEEILVDALRQMHRAGLIDI
jgi:tape measure domain-containing protein